MHLSHRLTELALRPHLPRRTVRLRLTLLYGILFLLLGTGLLAITYVLVSRATGAPFFYATRRRGVSVPGSSNGVISGAKVHDSTAPQLHAQAQQLQAFATQQHAAELHQLLVQSGIALAIMAMLSIALGWLIAGRVLHPLRTITTAARDISVMNLHERLDLDGPEDELKELADTFDELLGRLERSFQSQRQFVANASHELRTPLARQRTLIQVALSDPNATVKSLRAAHERVLVSGEMQDRLIDALLALTRGQAGSDRRDTVDLAITTRQVLKGREHEAERRGLHMDIALAPALISGDARLVESLVVNLVDNALCHNVPRGQVKVTTGTKDAKVLLTVSNTGPVIPETEVDRLFQPFQRLGAERTATGEHLGLGLCIVDAIAAAHDGTVTTRPQASGGLAIEVRFPTQTARADAPPIPHRIT